MKSAHTLQSLPTTTPGPITSSGAEVWMPGGKPCLALNSATVQHSRSANPKPTTHTYKAVLRQESLRDGQSL